MRVIQSKMNPKYSVTVYPSTQYGGGSGYYFHETGSGKAISPLEIKKAGGRDALKELRPKANELMHLD